MATSIDGEILEAYRASLMDGIDDEDYECERSQPEESCSSLLRNQSLSFSHPPHMTPLVHYKTPTGAGTEELHYLQYLGLDNPDGPYVHNVFIKVGRGEPGGTPDGKTQRIDLNQSQMKWLGEVFEKAQEGIVNRLLGTSFLKDRSPDVSWMSIGDDDE